MPGTVRSSQDHDLWGVGIRTGLDGSWYLYKGWSIFANTALSAIWTDYDVKRTDRFQLDTDPLPTITYLAKQKESSVKGTIEFQLGLKGEWWFSDQDYYLSISAAYEQQVWLNYGNYMFIIDKETGDLSLHGGTFKVKLGF